MSHIGKSRTLCINQKRRQISMKKNTSIVYEDHIPQYDQKHESEAKTDCCITFRQLGEMWLDLKRITSKASTEMKYDYMLDRHIYPAIGDYLISDLNRTLLVKFIHEKLKKGRLDGTGGLSPSYVRTISILINTVLKFGYQENLCDSLQINRVIPSSDKPTPQPLSVSEQKRLENYIFCHPSCTAAGVLLALRAGLRIGEVCALRWKEVSFDEKIISIGHTVIRSKDDTYATSYRVDTPKTKTSKRDIPLTEALEKVLKTIHINNRESFVVSGEQGFVIPPTFEYRYHRLLAKAGIQDVNFHTLRHTFATRCIEAGMDDKSLSEILGHSNVNITLNTYVHSSMKLKTAQMEKLSTMLLYHAT